MNTKLVRIRIDEEIINRMRRFVWADKGISVSALVEVGLTSYLDFLESIQGGPKNKSAQIERE
jgi:hypothetical protein